MFKLSEEISTRITLLNGVFCYILFSLPNQFIVTLFTCDINESLQNVFTSEVT